MECTREAETAIDISNNSSAHISRTSSHSAAIKALQFNPFRPELLATAGNKGELYIQDINTGATPSRLGTAVARADDFEAVDWNKKVAHILVTGSSGGFATVWDVKQKKESLTLNNAGRKSISAIAWDPTVPTKLATATSNDQDPVILLWDLRNSNAPEKTLRLHDQGILSLSWCLQDPRLLLSCGKDNRTVCWNTTTGEALGEFPIVTNWTFQTRWNPYSPGLLATASFDGKISVHNTQSTNVDTSKAAAAQSLDATDFFASAQTTSQGSGFSLPVAPSWLERPTSVHFGFGGKLIKLSSTGRQSKISIDTFIADPTVGAASDKFEEVVSKGEFTDFCEGKITQATTEEEKADWTVIETLISGSRSKLVDYLGISATEVAAPAEDNKEVNGVSDDSFFGGDGQDNFLSQLASTKGVKTNNPFQIYTGKESDADKRITQALMLGSFEQALDICLKEDRLSDAFMIAICGGQKCIEKAQAAYFKKSGDGPNYLRLIASVVGKNLWDVVYNADLSNWKEVMATLCTFADEKEFPDLCEALGDRLEEQMGESTTARKDASFCYLAGSKLEKVVLNWAQELAETEKEKLNQDNADSDFSVHAHALQDFIEKVTVFRQVAKFQDPELSKSSNWKMDSLYTKYAEYADILASQGKLEVAGRYLDLLPQQYPDAQAARDRVSSATRKAPAAAQRQTSTLPAQQQRAQRVVPTAYPTQPVPSIPAAAAPSPYSPAGFSQPAAPQQASPYAPAGVSASPYAPTGYQPQQPAAAPFQPQGYGIPAAQPYGGTGYSQFGSVPPPPPRGATASPAITPAAQTKTVNQWNDTPDFGSRQPARRATPVVSAPVHNPYAPAGGMAAPPGPASFAPPQKASLPPPPKAGETRITSPPPSSLAPMDNRPNSSAAASQYSPAATPVNTLPPPTQPPMPRGASPYNPPPSSGPTNNRYAPAPGSAVPAPQMGMGGPGARQIAPPPSAGSYAPPSMYGQQAGAPPPANNFMSAPAPPPKAGPPPPAARPAPPPMGGGGPPRAPPANGISQTQLPPPERPASAAPPSEATPAAPKYRKSI